MPFNRPRHLARFRYARIYDVLERDDCSAASWIVCRIRLTFARDIFLVFFPLPLFIPFFFFRLMKELLSSTCLVMNLLNGFKEEGLF